MIKHTYIIGGELSGSLKSPFLQSTVESNKKPDYRKMAGFLFFKRGKGVNRLVRPAFGKIKNENLERVQLLFHR